MKQQNKKKILILGSTGMLGRMISYVFSQNPTFFVIQTSRESGDYTFSIKASRKDLNEILNKNQDISFIINCIGETQSKNKKILEKVNGWFPNELSVFAESNKIPVIHISTDGVFGIYQKNVTEKTKPTPSDEYGKSKLAGEINSSYVLNIRTSLLGFSPDKKTGLLEFILQSKNKSINGFINQSWTGATVLQVARLCEWVVSENKFYTIRKKTHIIHFVPLGPITKYTIIKEFVEIKKLPIQIIKAQGQLITRSLVSHLRLIYPEKIYTRSLRTALKKLILIEQRTSH